MRDLTETSIVDVEHTIQQALRSLAHILHHRSEADVVRGMNSLAFDKDIEDAVFEGLDGLFHKRYRVLFKSFTCILFESFIREDCHSSWLGSSQSRRAIPVCN